MCCSPRGHKESDMTERLNQTVLGVLLMRLKCFRALGTETWSGGQVGVGWGLMWAAAGVGLDVGC